MNMTRPTGSMLKTGNHAALFLAFLIISLTGCSSDTQLKKIYDSDAVAKTVMASFDKDRDGKLSEQELLACPALQSAQARIDLNQDGVLDASEISRRVAAYAAMSDYIMADVSVKRGLQPLAGVNVTLRLADFMGTGPIQFAATTDAAGIGTPVSDQAEIIGFPLGFYDVEIVSQVKTWRFGIEVADDTPSANRLDFHVKAK